MNLNTSLKLRLSAISLALLVSSCASTPDGEGVKSDGEDQYWYCAPGDKKSWRCAENKEVLGLSYYRFWKTIPDPEAEGTDELQLDPQKQVDTPVLVQGAKLGLLTEEDTIEKKTEQEVELEQEAGSEAVKPAITKEQPSQKKYPKVLQLAAYNSQAQAQSFADTLNHTLSHRASVVRTKVKGQLFYTVVFDQLKSKQQAEQLIAGLAKSFPDIQPWLRSRSGFEAIRLN
ncbi:hypothetical protein CW740_09700 [Kangiella profundi]|uniref:Uncharacterized protein n=1 Tax=Kangiella profundi TaxID=1561924 RepID=A0A2K9A9U6_9GAMM|nr:SPOR domain-containing protein [Kangiella profundi]AUD79500.1 hypothetical protein CW740_09700 [Kangiella profundi]GGE98002.1 hypothetical protein GCM10011356_09710 [Kangiella profundi]